MATKPNRPITHTVNVKVDGELSIVMTATTMEDALTEARKLSFGDIVSEDYDNLSIDTEVTGVFRNH